MDDLNLIQMILSEYSGRNHEKLRKAVFKVFKELTEKQEQMQALDERVCKLLAEKRELSRALDERDLQIENLKNRLTKCSSISCYNIYREQVEQYESFFGGSLTFIRFPSFKIIMEVFTPLFNEERRVSKLDVIPIDSLKFRTDFTRIEKWRLIIFWLFIDKITPSILLGEDSATEDYFAAHMQNIKSALKLNEKEFCKDALKVQEEGVFDNLRILRSHCINNLKFSSFGTTTVDYIIFVMIRDVSVGINQAYNRSFRHLKSFKDPLYPEDEYETLVNYEPKVPCESAPEKLIELCFKLMLDIRQAS